MLFLNSIKFRIFIFVLAFILSAVLAGRFVVDNYTEKNINNILHNFDSVFKLSRKKFSLLKLYYTLDISEVKLDFDITDNIVFIKDLTGIEIKYVPLSKKLYIKLPNKLDISFFDKKLSEYEKFVCTLSSDKDGKRDLVILNQNNKRNNYKMEIEGLNCKKESIVNEVSDIIDGKVNFSYESSGVSYNGQNKLSVFANMEYVIKSDEKLNEKIFESTIVSNMETVITDTQRDFYISIEDYMLSLPLINSKININGNTFFSIIDGTSNMSFNIYAHEYKKILKYFLEDKNATLKDLIEIIESVNGENEDLSIKIETVDKNIIVNNTRAFSDILDSILQIPTVYSYINDLTSLIQKK